MEVSKFNEKLNRVDGKIYVIEEVVNLVDGIYEAELIHDNVNLKTINIYTGTKLTGDKINTYSTSTPSLTPWKTVIKIFSTEPKLYISYETTGDTVEAEDVNNVQIAINDTQNALNSEISRANDAEKVLTDNLTTEVTRAKNSEKNISDNLGNEIIRSKNKENELLKAIENETKRASDTEISITKNLDIESNRAKKKEEELNSNINTTNVNLASEVNRSTNAEKLLTDNLNIEINRSKSAEKTLTENLNSEISRAKSAESDIASKLNQEVNRAKNKEDSLEGSLDNYKTSNNAEIQKLREKDADLQNKKSDKTYVDEELNKRYTKDQTFTKEEVLQKIKDVIGTAPEALDTLQEIAKALNNDSNFAGTMTKQLATKVDKVQGKQLSDENYTLVDKNKLARVEDEANKYIHPANHSADMIVENPNKRFITDTEKSKWNTVDNKIDKNGGSIDGVLKILGTAESKSLITRGIQGSDGNGEIGELYLNYNNNNPVYVNGTNKIYHEGYKPNKNDVGLKNVDNTSDLDKPISNSVKNAFKDFLTHGNTVRIENQDLNTLKDTGFYSIVNCKNSLYKFAYCIVLKWNSNNDVCQILIPNDSISNNTMTIRLGSNNGAWSEFKQFSFEGHTHIKSQITDMPTKLSQFNNDAGFITQKDVDTSQNHIHSNKLVLDKITQSLIDSWNDINNKIDKTGDTVLGKILFNQGISVKNINGGAGASGYMHLAQIKITSNYQNQPIVFNIHQRERLGSVIIKFNSQNSSDPTLAYINKIGSSGFNAYICKSATSTWDLYLQKSEGYDSIDIVGFSKGDYMSSTLVTWKSSTVASLPSGYTTASVGYLDIGVTKATQDENGNNIANTYAKKGMTWNELEGL